MNFQTKKQELIQAVTPNTEITLNQKANQKILLENQDL